MILPVKYKMKPPPSARLISGHPLSRGLAGLWLFNEGSGRRVFDLSGNNKTGNFVGDTAWVAGKFGSCLSFDGTGDYVDTSLVNIGNLNAYTIVSWAKTTNNGSQMEIVGWAPETNPIIQFGKYGAENQAMFHHRDDSSITASMFSAGPAINDGKWHQIVGVRYAANNFKLLVDTVIVNTSTGSPGTTTLTTTSIGCLPRVTPVFFWNGTIDDVMIYNRALSASEIAQLYREPFCMFERTPSKAYFFVSAVAPPLEHPYYYREFANRRVA